MNDLRTFGELREDLKRLGIARVYYQAVRRMILQMLEHGVIKKTELEVGKKYSVQKTDDFLNYNLFTQMLENPVLIDSYLLGEPRIMKWGTKTIKNKTYKTVVFYPESCTKTVRVFGEIPED